jgi:hypothetical protein
MSRRPRFWRRSALLALAVAPWGCAYAHPTVPRTTQAPGPRPSVLLAARQLHHPPALTGSGADAQRATLAFIDWAAFSTVSEQEDGRKVIASARDNKDVAATLCAEAFKAQKENHSRALVVLGILGEMRSPLGEECLSRFMQLPFPQEGRAVDGEIMAQTALGTLQAKAIDGLAYLHNATGDAEVLRAVAAHPSRIVRAEAVNAYLWNHQDSAEARATLAGVVRKGEEIFLDRVRHEPGQGKERFNRSLEAYLAAHPEAVAPAPERSRYAPVPASQYHQQRPTNNPPPPPPQ